MLVNLTKNIHNIGHVAREGRQTLLNRLLITNIGKDFFKNTNTTSLVCQNRQTGLGHDLRQAQSFEHDGLPTCIGTCNDNGC